MAWTHAPELSVAGDLNLVEPESVSRSQEILQHDYEFRKSPLFII